MGQHGLAEPLQKTRLHSFVTEGEFEGCRPKAEALEEAFVRLYWLLNQFPLEAPPVHSAGPILLDVLGGFLEAFWKLLGSLGKPLNLSREGPGRPLGRCGGLLGTPRGLPGGTGGLATENGRLCYNFAHFRGTSWN